MRNKIHLPNTRQLGFCLLIWCLSSLLLPETLKAQCAVYFSHCPGDIIITDCDNSGDVTLEWPTPLAATTGGCTNFFMAQTSGPLPGTVVPSPGVYTVTYAAGALDMATGKKAKAYCTITIHVEADNTPPVFTYCPPDITLYTGNEPGATGQWSAPIVEDNCDENVTVKSKTPCNTEFKIGVHHVTYEAVDAAGNTVYCTFTVTVIQGFPRPAGSRNGTGGSEKIVYTGERPLEFTLSPNPFQEQAAILVNQLPNEPVQVKMFDIRGRQVASDSWKAGSDNLLLDTGKLSPGVFYIKISTTDGAILSTLRGVKM